MKILINLIMGIIIYVSISGQNVSQVDSIPVEKISK